MDGGTGGEIVKRQSLIRDEMFALTSSVKYTCVLMRVCFYVRTSGSRLLTWGRGLCSPMTVTAMPSGVLNFWKAHPWRQSQIRGPRVSATKPKKPNSETSG